MRARNSHLTPCHTLTIYLLVVQPLNSGAP